MRSGNDVLYSNIAAHLSPVSLRQAFVSEKFQTNKVIEWVHVTSSNSQIQN